MADFRNTAANSDENGGRGSLARAMTAPHSARVEGMYFPLSLSANGNARVSPLARLVETPQATRDSGSHARQPLSFAPLLEEGVLNREGMIELPTVDDQDKISVGSEVSFIRMNTFRGRAEGGQQGLAANSPSGPRRSSQGMKSINRHNSLRKFGDFPTARSLASRDSAKEDMENASNPKLMDNGLEAYEEGEFTTEKDFLQAEFVRLDTGRKHVDFERMDKGAGYVEVKRRDEKVGYMELHTGLAFLDSNRQDSPGLRRRRSIGKVRFPEGKPNENGGELEDAVFEDEHGNSARIRFLQRDNGVGIGFTGGGRVTWSTLSTASRDEDDIKEGDDGVKTSAGVRGDTTVGERSLDRESDAEVLQVAPQTERHGGHIKKLRDIFESVDADHDGVLTSEELKKALMMSAKDNKVELRAEVVDELTAFFMERAKPGDKGLSFEAFVELLYDAEDRKESGGMGRSKSRLQKLFSIRQDPIDTLPPRPDLGGWIKEVRFFLINNQHRIWLFLVWAVCCGVVFGWRFIAYDEKEIFQVLGYWVSFSKGCAEIVKLNTALLFLLICKWTLGKLRQTFLGRVIPFDDRVSFHKIVAIVVFLAGLGHTFGFMAGSYREFANASLDYYKPGGLLADSYKHRPSYGELAVSRDAITGYVLIAILFVMSLFGLKSTSNWLKKMKVLTAGSGFGAFWYSHLLLAPAFVFLMFFHGSEKGFNGFPTTTTWLYIIGPFVIYLLEQAVTSFSSRIGSRSLDVIKVEILPGRVLALHLSSPPFYYRSGMYVYIKVPGVSTFEWHPFSITSAPSDFCISVHIRAVGDWTNAMLDFWAVEREHWAAIEAHNAATLALPDQARRPPLVKYRFPRVLVDGPFGAPAQDYEHFRVVVLVGAGIGVTPMASVIRDVLHKTKNRSKYPRFATEKVFFYWTTREQGSFQWFSDLMEQATEDDKAGIVEMHNYLTSAYGDDDPRAFLLKKAQDSYHNRTGVDIIANARTKIATHFARPKWDQIFDDIAAQVAHTAVGVFYCGPPALEHELAKQSRAHTVPGEKGKSFIFHKENF
eukprot:TRINITY_DN819_c0_g2_i5.p1 TRINITY_DN819_c0_g2~~TRINITY_DN819_c0_g2_i5.p1  ORF type:complete len:1048 (+),score=169.04 TRINITY_DN819_c0_g2_i5:366-3509(+)